MYVLYCCGDPAAITINDGFYCCRLSSEEYTIKHNFWHFFSASAPFITVYFFQRYKDVLPSGCLGSDMYLIQNDELGISYFPVVPTAVLIISLLHNIYGNHAGYMPMA